MLTTFIKKTMAFALSFSTLLGGIPAWAISTEEFVMSSWVGRPQEELLSAWGKPSGSQLIPGSKTHWIEYTRETSEYVPSLTYYNTPYDSKRYNYTSYSSSYYKNYNCAVSFEVDSTTFTIVNGSFRGNMCRNWYLYPAHVSKVGLNALKSQQMLVQEFQEKIDKSQRKVIKIRKDSHAYEAGLRNKDVILKSVKTQSGTELEIQRKEHWFSRSLVTQRIRFAPTYHSLAYELLSKPQRKQFNVED
jgi:hypothetical protein